MDSLVDALISWKYPNQLNSSLPSHDLTYDFEIEVVDIFSPSATAVISRSADSTSIPVALVHSGYLGTTPLVPSLAVSLKTLQLFHTIRMHRASFSVEAFAKVVCHWNKVCHSLLYSLLYIGSVSSTLSRCNIRCVWYLHWPDQPHPISHWPRTWAPHRVRNSCPACCYEVWKLSHHHCLLIYDSYNQNHCSTSRAWLLSMGTALSSGFVV